MGKKLKDGQSEVRIARLHTVRNISNSWPIQKETKKRSKGLKATSKNEGFNQMCKKC